MYTKHAEFKAGAIVLCALAALLGLLYYAGGAESIWRSYRYVDVRFSQGDVAPKKGDAVNMNGAQIGRVSSVTQYEELRGRGHELALTVEDRRALRLAPGEDGTVRELYLLARLKMPAEQILPVGTRARISKSLTGSRTLSLLPGNSEANLTDADTRTDPIPGSEIPGLDDIAGRINDLVGTINSVVAQGGDVMTEAKAVLQLVNEKIAAINTEELDRDLRASIASLRRTLEGAEERVAAIAANIEQASVDVKRVAEKGVGTVDDLRADLREVLAGIKEVVRKLDVIVADAKAPVDSFLADMATTGRNLKQLSSEFSGLGPQASQLLSDLGVDTKLLLGNLNDTAHNLLDASEDLRAHPWKLLNKPEEGQIAYENLRSAALNYTRTARDVNEASAHLRGLLTRADLDKPEVKKMVEAALIDFRASLDGYKAAERRWLKLFNEAGKVRRAPSGRKK